MKNSPKSSNNDKLLRLKEVLQLIPVSRSAWYLGIKQGIYPAPVKLGPRTSAWRKSDIDTLVDGGIYGTSDDR